MAKIKFLLALGLLTLISGSVFAQKEKNDWQEFLCMFQNVKDCKSISMKVKAVGQVGSNGRIGQTRLAPDPWKPGGECFYLVPSNDENKYLLVVTEAGEITGTHSVVYRGNKLVDDEKEWWLMSLGVEKKFCIGTIDSNKKFRLIQYNPVFEDLFK